MVMLKTALDHSCVYTASRFKVEKRHLFQKLLKTDICKLKNNDSLWMLIIYYFLNSDTTMALPAASPPLPFPIISHLFLHTSSKPLHLTPQTLPQ